MEKKTDNEYAPLGFALMLLLAIGGTILLFLRATFPDPQYPFWVPFLCFGAAHPLYVLFEHYGLEDPRPEIFSKWKLLLEIDAAGAVLAVIGIVLSSMNLLGDLSPAIGPIAVLLLGYPGYFYELHLMAKRFKDQEKKRAEVLTLSLFLFFLALSILAVIFMAKNQLAFGLLLLFIPLDLALRLGCNLA